MNKDCAYQIIDNDAVTMNNGDRMVDASTAYMAVDWVRADEREQVLTGWEPTTVPVTTTDLVEVLFADGTIREIVGDHVCNWVYPYIKAGYAVAWRLQEKSRGNGDLQNTEPKPAK